MQPLDFLNGYFPQSTIRRFAEIFGRAKTIRSESELRQLQAELLHVLRQEKPIELICWHVSPSGGNHILVVQNMCLMINVFGAAVLFKSVMFEEGELAISNFRWIERDHLVLFDVTYIVRDITDTFICHYARDSFFTYQVPAPPKNIPDFLR